MKKNFTALAALSRLSALVAALMLVALMGPQLASAHAPLVSSTPAEGSTIEPGLTQISMTFKEDISTEQSTAQLLDASGTQVAGSSFAVDRAERTKMVGTTPALAAGKYTVKLKSVTEDDNAILNGTLNFTVGTGSVPTTTGIGTGTGTTASPAATAMTSSGSATGSSTTSSGSTGSGTSNSSLPGTGAGDQPLLPTLVALAAALCIPAGLLARKRANR